MKRNLSVILLIIVIIISMVIGGCGQKEKNDGKNASNHTDVENQDPGNNDNEEKQDEETKEEEKPNEEIPKEVLEEYEDALIIKKEDGTIEVYESIETEEETPFVKVKKNGERVYLNGESPDVIMLLKAIAEYGKAIFNIDWETATGREEYHLLTTEAQKSFEKENVEQVALDFYKTYKIKCEYIGIEKYNLIEFYVNETVNEAIVDVDYAFVYENVENLANYVTGETYYAPEKVRFKLVGDKWLVDELIESRQRYRKEE